MQNATTQRTLFGAAPILRLEPTLQRLGWAALLALLAACSNGGNEKESAPDPRLIVLQSDCGPNGDRYYDRNTSEPVELLIEKLTLGQLEVVRRAREELGRLGEASVEALAREVDRNYANPMHAPRVQNALTALGLNAAPGARDVLLRGLDHPKETISQAALTGLLNAHVNADDFDSFLAHINSPIPRHVKRTFASGLYLADPERACALFAKWVRDGTHTALMGDALPLVAGTTDRDIAAQLFEHSGTVRPFLEAYLVAPAARLGNEAALARLREMFVDPRLERRTSAVLAASKAQLGHELIGLPAGEGSSELRIILLDEIALSGIDSKAIDQELAEAFADPGQRVRNFALKHSVRRGSEAGLAVAHAALEKGPADLQAAFDAFRARFSVEPTPPKLEQEIEKVRSQLIARVERESELTLADRAALFKGIGLCPGVASARFLRETGLAAGDARIEGLRAHQWLLIQSANTGAEALDFLAQELESETDVSRRLDIIDACGSSRSDASRERLLSIAEAPGTTSVERLIAANVLVRLGHTQDVASRLKRVLYAFDDADPARRPFQCLMWNWF